MFWNKEREEEMKREIKERKKTYKGETKQKEILVFKHVCEFFDTLSIGEWRFYVLCP